jgi:hypothetical protein
VSAGCAHVVNGMMNKAIMRKWNTVFPGMRSHAAGELFVGMVKRFGFNWIGEEDTKLLKNIIRRMQSGEMILPAGR